VHAQTARINRWSVPSPQIGGRSVQALRAVSSDGRLAVRSAHFKVSSACCSFRRLCSCAEVRPACASGLSLLLKPGPCVPFPLGFVVVFKSCSLQTSPQGHRQYKADAVRKLMEVNVSWQRGQAGRVMRIGLRRLESWRSCIGGPLCVEGPPRRACSLAKLPNRVAPRRTRRVSATRWSRVCAKRNTPRPPCG
jgi:hypothetical protein